MVVDLLITIFMHIPASNWEMMFSAAAWEPTTEPAMLNDKYPREDVAYVMSNLVDHAIVHL